jgi:hypothetical protein
MGAVRALVVGLAAGWLTTAGAGPASAQGGREAAGLGADKPMLAVVSLADQHITIYGASGKLTQAPVSSGSKDYETPAGIFSIVQKKEDHRSNLYQDGEMPFMQRITWTGIALHAGALPGYPASHGCVRLPISFARDLFDATELGMRVVIVREDMRPVDFSHPTLFKSKPVPRELGQGIGVLPQRRAQLGGAGAAEGEIVPGSARHVRILQSIAAAKAGELETAVKRLKETRTATTRAASEAAAAVRLVRTTEGTMAQAEGAVKAAEKQIEKAASPEAKARAEAAKEKAAARVDEVKAKLEAAKLQEQAKREASERAGVDAKAAVTAKELAAQAAEDAGRSTMPVSVLVSRKTQRLYVRRGTHPVFEAPVTINDADKSIGTFVFTALDHQGTQGDLRWSVVAMYKDPFNIPPASKDQPRRGKDRASKVASPSDAAAAKTALDRITIGKDALDIIVGDAELPGSSLIISDEGPSREIGKDTDFILIMSGEPQGALTVRQREPIAKDYFDESPWSSPWGSPWGSSKAPKGGYKSPSSSFWSW